MRSDDRELIDVGDDHRRHEAFGLAGEQIQIECQKLRTGNDSSTLRHMQDKSNATETHGIDADMHENFRAVPRANGDGVFRRSNRNDLAIARSTERVAGWIDENTIAQHALREYRIRRLIE